MARHRRTGSRNWARGVFAVFWILLGGVSGVYLFTVVSDPTALGGQLVKLNPLPESGSSSSDATTTSAIVSQTSEARDQELAEIKATLHEMAQQMAELSSRLKPIEKVVGPVAALPPAASVSTSMPSAPPPAPAAPPSTEKPAAAAAPPAEQAPQAEAPKPAEEPAPAAKPVEQAAVEPAPNPAEPPPVAVSPIDDDAVEEETAPSTNISAPTPLPPAEEAQTPAEATPAPAAAESAALDPVALPPAANDGSTRYGIEIGTVAKQDGLRPLWREFLTNHAALVAGLQPRRVLAPDKKWRLIAGPFGSASEAAQACALFKKASRPCEATVYAGDAL